MRVNVRAASDDEIRQIPCFKETLVRKLQREMPPEGTLEEAETLFSALADRARLKILFALGDGEELCVCDVAHVLWSPFQPLRTICGSSVI